jgi:hypothetical protein
MPVDRDGFTRLTGHFLCYYHAVSETYRHLVKQLGWSTLDVQVAGLSQFSKASAVETPVPASRRLQQTSSPTGLHKDLAYTLVVASILLGCILACHSLVHALWTFVLKRPLPDFLIMPCIEVLLAGFVLVALSFYASLPLGPNVPVSERAPASLAIHVALCLPYTAFLCYMAIQRSRLFLVQGGNATHTMITPNTNVQESEVSLVALVWAWLAGRFQDIGHPSKLTTLTYTTGCSRCSSSCW